jgi:hypothetical protein
MIEVARRSFITGLIALVAAPAIVRASSIMPVRSYIEPVTAADLAELMARLDDRAECFDGEYAERYGTPGHVDVMRSVIRRGGMAAPFDWSRLHG